MRERRERLGPLSEYWQGFHAHLLEQGYLPGSIHRQRMLFVSLNEFLVRQGLAVGELDDVRVAQFMAGRRAGGFTDRLSGRALVPLVGFLRGRGVLAAPPPRAPQDRCEEIIADYRIFLREERGLVPSSVACYARHAALLVRRLAGSQASGLGAIDAEAVIAFVAAEAARRRIAAAKQFVNATRWFLRYLRHCGALPRDYSVVVPGVAGWQQTAIPKGLPPGATELALAGMARESAGGLRNYALVYLIARLGLRAGEAVALTLDDIDWRRGTLFVRGKGHRDELMPLPADVGEVLAAYLADARQRRRGRHVFQRLHAPLGPLQGAAVHPIVRDAFARVGIDGVSPHCLRHAAATELLRRGGSLAEIGQVLRHRSAASTALYAKVDYGELAIFARPWPGSAR